MYAQTKTDGIIIIISYLRMIFTVAKCFLPKCASIQAIVLIEQ